MCLRPVPFFSVILPSPCAWFLFTVLLFTPDCWLGWRHRLWHWLMWCSRPDKCPHVSSQILAHLTASTEAIVSCFCTDNTVQLHTDNSQLSYDGTLIPEEIFYPMAACRQMTLGTYSKVTVCYLLHVLNYPIVEVGPSGALWSDLAHALPCLSLSQGWCSISG